MSYTPVKVSNGTDTYVKQNRPSDKHAGSDMLEVSNISGNARYAYISFARPFPKGVTILSATLRFTQRFDESGTRTVTLKKVTQAWTSTKMTWNNKPGVTSTDSKSVTKGTNPKYTVWEFDVQSHMQAVADGAAWYGWRLETSATTLYHQFFSANASVSGRHVKPTLEVVYIEKPSKPSQLSPAGGRVTALSQPVLRFDFTDAQGSTTMQAYQVQMNSSNSFTSPSFDTGTVLASVPQLDLASYLTRTATVTTTSASTAITSTDANFTSADVGASITGTGIPSGTTITAVSSATDATISAAATASGTVTATIAQVGAFAGLADGDTIYWRVRVQDDSGLWSSWSDATSFTRHVKPTLDMLNPSGNLIDEPTPPILWSLTGGTQSAWQVIVKDWVGNWLHSSGKTSSADTDYTIPAGVIRRDDATYRIEVRVWDTYQRESTPGDTSYISVSRTVTYDYDPTTDPVTSLSGAVDYPKPVVKLTWNRDLAPDSFVVRRDGDIIKSVLLPGDALVSGTTYAYTDYTASPGKAHIYSVHAVVNGKTSKTNPSVTVTPKAVGIWLMDPDSNVYVQLLDADDGTWNMGEEAGMYAPLGGTKSVRVTQALRGYEGSLSGLLVETPDSLGTIEEQEDAVWSLKSRPGRTYTLALSDMSMKVVIGNVVVAPLPTRETMKKVSFEFWAQEAPFTAEM